MSQSRLHFSVPTRIVLMSSTLKFLLLKVFHNRVVFFPSPEMIHITLISYLVIIEICESDKV